MKKVIGIAGSPRRNGNSERALDSMLKGVEMAGGCIEKIVIRDINVSPCNSCGGCHVNGICVIDDDMQKMYPKLIEADGIIVASPLYFMGVSAQLKTFIDRFQSFWSRKYLLNQPIREGGIMSRGYFIATAARSGSEELFIGAIKTIKAFFHVSDTKYTGDLLFSGLEEKDALINTKPELLQQAFTAGKQFFSVIK
ncbi:MAG: hypothetical protein HW390_239 [Candidatus Brocadiaceae bacterium]|nr:hypothetical protein [Candidatus Brocadiaceae bacterium]